MLVVQFNALKGPILMTIFNMSSSTISRFHGNSLTGNLSDNICQYLPSIQQLYFSFNQLDGPLSSKLCECKQLDNLQLENNNLSRNIPNNIGNLAQIKGIDLGSLIGIY